MISLKRIFAAFLAALTFAAALAVVSLAEGEGQSEEVTAEAEARNVVKDVKFSASGRYAWDNLTDGSYTTHVEFGVDRVKVSSDEPIAGVYLLFYVKPSAWEIEANGVSVECGQNGFVHEYVDLSEAGPSGQITMTFPRGADIAEIELYTEGVLPDKVQTWEAPLDGGADLVLFATHAGDEHTFFAGVLPMAMARGARCEVVYFVDHSDEPRRIHETLNGLWEIGDRYYPILGAFPDVYAESKGQAIAAYAAQGYGEDDFADFLTENIRRFRPQVLVIHDENGEDGEGANIINSEAARNAVLAAAESDRYPMSVAEYGVWDTPKVYMHLCKDGGIELDLDSKLDRFDGRSAYEMACVGFAQHKSLHYSWRYEWLMGIDHEQAASGGDDGRFTSAKQIENFSPIFWGLWRSTVGADETNDMFDNIVFYTRPGDETAEETQKETESAAETQTDADTAADTAALINGSQSDNPERERMMKIVAICAAAVVAGTILALIISGARSRGETKHKKEIEERRHARTEENARKVREARDERAKIEAAEDAADVRRLITSNSASDHDPSGKGAEREAAIRAARAAREAGAAAHDKPTDKKY